MFVGAMECAAVLVLAGFALACTAIARACFSARPDGTAVRRALLWGAAFVVQVLGTVMARDAIGGAAALGWSAMVPAGAGAASFLWGRRWCERAMEREAMRMRLLAAQQDRGRAEGDGLKSASADDAGRLRSSETPEPARSADDLAARCAQVARAFDLTRREEDVLVLLATGRTAAEVAQELVVSSNTVKTHIRNLYRKLGINRRGDLAERLGL